MESGELLPVLLALLSSFFALLVIVMYDGLFSIDNALAIFSMVAHLSDEKPVWWLAAIANRLHFMEVTGAHLRPVQNNLANWPPLIAWINLPVRLLIGIYAGLPAWLRAPEQAMALQLGIFGAMAFRFLLMFTVTALLSRYPWLIYVAAGYLIIVPGWKLYKYYQGHGGGGHGTVAEGTGFILTVLLVEGTDVALSLDNALIILQITQNIPLIMIGLLISIIMIRKFAVGLSKISDRYPRLEPAGLWVLIVIGIEIGAAHWLHFHFPEGLTPVISFSLVLGMLWFSPQRETLKFDLRNIPIYLHQWWESRQQQTLATAPAE